LSPMPSLTLAEAVERVFDLDYLEPLQLGQTIRVLVDLHKPDKHELEQVAACIVEQLKDDTELLADAEFHEGLHKAIPVRFFVRGFRANFLDFDEAPDASPCRCCALLTSLAPVVDVTKGSLHELRAHASAAHIRSLVARLADATVDDVASLAHLLRKFFHPSEAFEVADALALCVRADWFLDVVPRQSEKARALFEEHLISVFPSTRPVLENFLEHVDTDAASSEDDGSSLADFIVSDSDCSDLDMSSCSSTSSS
jgi:hypothetical protein